MNNLTNIHDDTNKADCCAIVVWWQCTTQSADNGAQIDVMGLVLRWRRVVLSSWTRAAGWLTAARLACRTHPVMQQQLWQFYSEPALGDEHYVSCHQKSILNDLPNTRTRKQTAMTRPTKTINSLYGAAPFTCSRTMGWLSWHDLSASFQPIMGNHKDNIITDNN